jgi:hypothetical protein
MDAMIEEKTFNWKTGRRYVGSENAEGRHKKRLP